VFERTAVRRPTDITGLAGFDTGALAESLLFYGTTSLVLDPGSLKEILRNVGVDSVVRLARDDAVRVLYAPNMTTIPNAGSLPAAGWGLSTVSTPAWQPDRFIPDAFYEVMGRRGAARRASSRFLDRLELVSPDAFRPDSDEAVIAETVSEQAVREVLRYVAPGYALPADVRFEVSYDNAAGYAVQTNLDFSAITAEHQRFYNTTNDVTVSHVLLTLAGVAEDVGMAAYFGSDLTLEDDGFAWPHLDGLKWPHFAMVDVLAG